MYWQAFKYLFDFIVIIILPVAITGYAIWVNRGIFEQGGSGSFFSKQIFSVLKNFGFLFLSYIFGRLLSMARLSAPKSLFPFAKSVFEKSAGIQIVTFGHSHTPQQFRTMVAGIITPVRGCLCMIYRWQMYAWIKHLPIFLYNRITPEI
jgi:hypothetical protein